MLIVEILTLLNFLALALLGFFRVLLILFIVFFGLLVFTVTFAVVVVIAFGKGRTSYKYGGDGQRNDAAGKVKTGHDWLLVFSTKKVFVQLQRLGSHHD